MNEKLLCQLAANEAWAAVQKAYELLYGTGPEAPSDKDKREADELLQNASKWLTALKG